MKKRPTNLHRQATKTSRDVPVPLAHKKWAAFFYLCGDHESLLEHVERNLAEILQVGASPNLHVAVQIDRPTGGERLLVAEGGAPVARTPLGPVNTGEPQSFVSFLEWGLVTCPATRAIVVVSGMGIFDGGSLFGRAGERARLFSICDDATAGDAMDAPELGGVFVDAFQGAGLPGTRVDLLAFDMCETQFVEIAYELKDVVDVVVGAQTLVPLRGWRYDDMLRRWHGLLADPPDAEDLVRTLAKTTAESAARAYAEVDPSISVSALDLRSLDEVARRFDALLQGLIQTMGAFPIWEARERIAEAYKKSIRISASADDLVYDLRRLSQAITQAMAETPVVARGWWIQETLARLARNGTRTSLARSLKAVVDDGLPLENLPGVDIRIRSIVSADPILLADYEQLVAQCEDAKRLSALAQRLDPVLDPAEPNGFVIACYGSERGSGVSLYRPSDGSLDDLAFSNYTDLRFHGSIHWAPYLATVNLVKRHPHALWRLVSSMLASASPTAREDVLRRIVGPQSVLARYREQFRALATAPGLNLVLEEIQLGNEKTGGPGYRLRLQAGIAGATIIEQERFVNKEAIDSTLRRLESLLSQRTLRSEEIRRLETIGQSLSENIVSDLYERIEEAAAEMRGREGNRVHLTLQLPRTLMKYPWELMRDTDGWLSDKYALGRQVFMESEMARWVPRSRSGELRALVIADPVFDSSRSLQQLPGARAEGNRVVRILQELASAPESFLEFDAECDAWVGRNVAAEDFLDVLRKGTYDFIHFAGHAGFDPKRSDRSGWEFSDRRLWALEIRNTLRRRNHPPWFVFANACEAGMDAASKPVARYQRDVFGLASAFINQGVSAYVAPLWPIDDGVGAFLAHRFYVELLQRNETIGNALRLAKLAAAEALAAESQGQGFQSVQRGLGWASLVLYGDPTAATPQAFGAAASVEMPSPKDDRAPRRRVTTLPAPRYRATSEMPTSVSQIVDAVQGPGMSSIRDHSRRRVGSEGNDGNGMVVQIVERNDIRRWQVYDDGVGRFIQIRGTNPTDESWTTGNASRGRGDTARILWRWTLDHEDASAKNLARQYDTAAIPREQLVEIQDDGELTELQHPLGELTKPGDRVLLLLHSTFTSTASVLRSLGPAFLRWIREHGRYRTVLGFDHWTVLRSPDDNARELLKRLGVERGATLPQLDVIAHGRGGLVARWITEIERCAPRQVVFVGTPHHGTPLADRQQWGRAADLLLNLTDLDATGVYGKLSSLLVRLVVGRIEDQLPGLEAQTPESSFLSQLQQSEGPHPGTKYAAVAASFTPDLTTGSLLKSLLSGTANLGIDPFFEANPNDLVVGIASALRTRNSSMSVTDPALAGALVFVGPDDVPAANGTVAYHVRSGVHHTNLLGLEETATFLRGRLHAP